MDEETALNPRTLVSIYAAMDELNRHGFQSYQLKGELYAAPIADREAKPERICIVQNGQVVARRVMVWLGY
jgi:hypothetical protein